MNEKHTEHTERIREELKKAGVTPYGFMKMESRHISGVIHEDEHIHGVAYGRFTNGSAMLLATNKRVIFYDKKPLFNTTDELTYDVVSGINLIHHGPFLSVILHTRVGDYTLHYVNKKSAERFRNYIESHRLETGGNGSGGTFKAKEPSVELPSEAKKFLSANELAILSSVDRTGNVYGSAVYYYLPGDGNIYVVTKSETQKVRNVFAHSQIAMTVVDADNLRTLQLQGTAEVETDPNMKQLVFSQVVRKRRYGVDQLMPPVLKVKDGGFVILRITPTSARFSDFKQD